VLSDPAARRVTALAVSPDDRLLASAADAQNRRSEIILWDVATGRRQGILPTGSESIHALAFGPKGATLAVLCNVPDGPGRVLKVWDVSRLPEPPVLRWTLPHLNEIALAPNGRALATVDHQGETTVRDLASGQLTVVCQGGAFLSNGLTFSPDGRRLYTGGQVQDVQSWELPSGRPLVRFETDYWIKQFIVAPDGQTLATTNPEGRLDLWDALSGQRRNALEVPPAEINSLAFAPDCKALAATSPDSIVVWNLASGERRTYPYPTGYPHKAVFTADSRNLIISSGDPVVRLWRLDPPPEPPQPLGHSKETWATVFAPNGRTLATAGDDNTVKLWNPANGQELATLKGHDSTVTSLAFSPDGQTLVSGSLDGKARLWNLADRRTRLILGHHQGGVRAVAVSRDGRRLATAGSDQIIRLWKLADGRPGPILRGHTSSIRALAFAPDGRTLASAGNDMVVRLWDLNRNREIQTLPTLQHVISLAYSPNGAWLTAADEDGEVWIWNAATYTSQMVLKTHPVEARCLAFTPDSQTLASGGLDRVVRLCDVVTGQELIVLKGHAQKINALAFSPDGQTLASGSHDGAVRLWRSSPLLR
jgi:WD40 repeat protein